MKLWAGPPILRKSLNEKNEQCAKGVDNFNFRGKIMRFYKTTNMLATIVLIAGVIFSNAYGEILDSEDIVSVPALTEVEVIVRDGTYASILDGAYASILDGAYASILDGAYASIWDGAYASIRGGMSFLPQLKYSKEDIVQDAFKNKAGYSFGGALGFKHKQYRVELEGTRLGNNGKLLTRVVEGSPAILAVEGVVAIEGRKAIPEHIVSEINPLTGRSEFVIHEEKEEIFPIEGVIAVEGRDAVPSDIIEEHIDVDITTVMVNAYYDFDNLRLETFGLDIFSSQIAGLDKLVPFVGVGIGYASATIIQTETSSRYGNSSVISKNNLFAYQGLAGVSYFIQNNASIDLFYKHLRTTKPSIDRGLEKVKLKAIQVNTVNVGLTYRF